MLTPEDVTKAVKDYDEAIAAAQRKRARTFAQAAAQDMPQKDVIAASGYSRETVRRITREGQAETVSGSD